MVPVKDGKAFLVPAEAGMGSGSGFRGRASRHRLVLVFGGPAYGRQAPSANGLRVHQA